MTKVAKYAGINASDNGPGVIINATKGDFIAAGYAVLPLKVTFCELVKRF